MDMSILEGVCPWKEGLLVFYSAWDDQTVTSFIVSYVL